MGLEGKSVLATCAASGFGAVIAGSLPELTGPSASGPATGAPSDAIGGRTLS